MAVEPQVNETQEPQEEPTQETEKTGGENQEEEIFKPLKTDEDIEEENYDLFGEEPESENTEEEPDSDDDKRTIEYWKSKAQKAEKVADRARAERAKLDSKETAKRHIQEVNSPAVTEKLTEMVRKGRRANEINEFANAFKKVINETKKDIQTQLENLRSKTTEQAEQDVASRFGTPHVAGQATQAKVAYDDIKDLPLNEQAKYVEEGRFKPTKVTWPKRK